MVHLFLYQLGGWSTLKKSQFMNSMSVAQAAELAGVGKSTVRRAIKKGDLLATVEDGPNGEQFSISMSSFEEWMASRGTPLEKVQNEPGTAIGAPVAHQSDGAWDAVIESQQTVQKALAALEKAQSENLKMVHQVFQLQGELSSQKMMLSSNAESLQQKEEKLSKIESAKQKEIEDLARHNAEQKERFEKEREEMLAKLKEAEGTAQRYEKMPKWVRSMFGT